MQWRLRNKRWALNRRYQRRSKGVGARTGAATDQVATQDATRPDPKDDCLVIEYGGHALQQQGHETEIRQLQDKLRRYQDETEYKMVGLGRLRTQEAKVLQQISDAEEQRHSQSSMRASKGFGRPSATDSRASAASSATADELYEARPENRERTSERLTDGLQAPSSRSRGGRQIIKLQEGQENPRTCSLRER